VIDRQGSKIIIECDSCGEVLDTETADFEAARAAMRDEGWKIRKVADVWLHGCPRCGVPD